MSILTKIKATTFAAITAFIEPVIVFSAFIISLNVTDALGYKDSQYAISIAIAYAAMLGVFVNWLNEKYLIPKAKTLSEQAHFYDAKSEAYKGMARQAGLFFDNK